MHLGSLLAWSLAACMENQLARLPDPPVEDTASVTPPPAADEARAPLAAAGPDREVSPLESVALDGSRSKDPDGLEIVTMAWRVVSQPDGSTATLDDPGSARPGFFADLAGDYVFELTVENEAGVWDPTPDRVTITAVPLDGFYVELSWDAPTDLDLHLAEGAGRVFGPADCNYCNLSPDFGGGGSSDDASLDADAIDGWGPETITIDEPAAGDYTVRVHFYGENGSPSCPGGCPASTATVRVFLGGVEAATFRRQLSGQGALWDVVTIDWPSGRIEELNTLDRTDETSCF